MLTKFSEGLGDKLAERWLSALLTPAFAFWAGGLLAWIWHHDLSTLVQRWEGLGTLGQVAVIVGALLLVVTSAAAMRRFEGPLLRLLEGYWPSWLDWLRDWLADRQRGHYFEMQDQWQALATKGIDALSTGARRQYLELDYRLRFYPTPEDLMPSALGNRLRAAETWPFLKYGLDAIVCWPRLWLALPEGVQQEIGEAREALNAAVRLMAWGALFIVWTVWAWWAAVAGVATVWFGYRVAVNSAETYGSLVESAYDLYRWKLYEVLRWPPPQTPAEERTIGQAVTEYLWRGSDTETLIFEAKGEEE